jgi:hypothetical protein
MRNQPIWNRSQWRGELFYMRNGVSINRKSRNECSAPLEIALMTFRRCEDFLSAIGYCIHSCR